MKPREQQRGLVLNEMLVSCWSVEQAATVLGPSERHVWRILAAYGARVRDVRPSFSITKRNAGVLP